MRFWIFAAFLLSAQAHAFPEMIRDHYVNCNSCHVSPAGGGLLTPYGRGMASEVLSTWNYENESLFLHGALKPDKIPGFFNVGGDVRAVQVHRENANVREGRYVLMQTSLEAAATAGPITAVAAFGEPDALNHVHGEFTHYYLLGNVSETVQVMAGRFTPAFGVNDPHHILSTRQTLGFGFENERNAVEAHYSGEQWHAAIGASHSLQETPWRQTENAGSFQVEKFFFDNYRVGVSGWVGESTIQKRRMVAVHGIFGFTEHLYALTETAWQFRQSLTVPAAPWETGIFHNVRFGYEAWKGVHLAAFEDISQSVLSTPNTLSVQIGAGPVWYPRPHFEFELTYSQRKILRQGPDFETYAYLMAHYYL